MIYEIINTELMFGLILQSYIRMYKIETCGFEYKSNYPDFFLFSSSVKHSHLLVTDYISYVTYHIHLYYQRIDILRAFYHIRNVYTITLYVDTILLSIISVYYGNLF